MQLRYYQQNAINALYKYLGEKQGNPCIVMPTGCHEYGHPILMAGGTTKPVQSVCIGDIVVGPDSLPRTVLNTCFGYGDMYRITPIKGEPFVVNGDHVLSLECTNEGKKFNCNKNGYEIDNITVRDYLGKAKYWKHLRKVRRVPVEFYNTYTLPIPPYILGVLIGDGCLRNGISVAKPDKEVIDELHKYAEEFGLITKTTYGRNGECPHTSICKKKGMKNPLSSLLKELGLFNKLSHEKYIPQIYKAADYYDKLEMLAGILDTDGHMVKSGYDYISKSEMLADDVVFMARSVGLYAKKVEKWCECQTGAGGIYYRVHISGDCSCIPCRIQRKKSPERKQKKSVLKTGFTVTRVEDGMYYGFTLDGDHLYVDGNFVVHHNSGKTPLLTTMCKDVIRWGGRALVLSHVKELLEQSRDTLLRIDDTLDVGVYSAGLKSRDTENAVVIAGIQSVYERAAELGRFDVIIIDESHLIPPDGEGRYQTFIAAAKLVNPKVRIVGLTATPFRMTSGMLCGPDNILTDICYEVGVKELIVHGFLCPLVSKIGVTKYDMSVLHQRAGEYIQSEVEELMDDDAKTKAIVRELGPVLRERKSILVFASSVNHAKHVAEQFNSIHGVEAGIVVGDTPSPERDSLLRRFKGESVATDMLGGMAGPLQIIVNMNVLTTGFDATNIDCIVLLRPTLSPGLYVQMVGRGFRINEGKRDCLVLDYGGNIMRHGPIDLIEVSTRSGGKKGVAPQKECPECHSVVMAGCAQCVYCGYFWPVKTPTDKLWTNPSEEDILSGQVTDEVFEITDVVYDTHYKKGDMANTPTLKVMYYYDVPGSFRTKYECEWICLEHSGFAREKATKWWTQRTYEPCPRTIKEALEVAMAGLLLEPKKITVRRVSGEKFTRIINYEFKEVSDSDESDLEEIEITKFDDEVPF